MQKMYWLTRTVIFLIFALVIHLLKMPDLVTDTIINAVLLLAALQINIPSGVVIGIITPFLAVLSGGLPFMLLTLVPFIILGNILYILICGQVGKKKELSKNSIIGYILSGSVIKFLILFVTIKFIIDVPESISNIMQYHQLVTAILGAVLAFFIYKVIERNSVDRAE